MTINDSAHRRSGRVISGLLALGLGLLITLAVLVLIKFVSNDMRRVLWVGSAGLLMAALWAGVGGEVEPSAWYCCACR